MTGIEKLAAFYRGYLIDERSLAPLATALATIVGVWLLVYVLGAVAGALPVLPAPVSVAAFRSQ